MYILPWQPVAILLTAFIIRTNTRFAIDSIQSFDRGALFCVHTSIVTRIRPLYLIVAISFTTLCQIPFQFGNFSDLVQKPFEGALRRDMYISIRITQEFE